jgi:hypothetical protein
MEHETQAILNAQTTAALAALQREIELHNTAFRDFVMEMKVDHGDHEVRIRNVETRISQAIGALGLVALIASIVLHFWK